jgi:hypothetical protein
MARALPLVKRRFDDMDTAEYTLKKNWEDITGEPFEACPEVGLENNEGRIEPFYYILDLDNAQSEGTKAVIEYIIGQREAEQELDYYKVFDFHHPTEDKEKL